MLTGICIEISGALHPQEGIETATAVTSGGINIDNSASANSN